MSRAKDVPKNAGKLLSVNGLIKAGDIILAKRSWMNELSSKVIDWQPAREVEGTVIFVSSNGRWLTIQGKHFCESFFAWDILKVRRVWDANKKLHN